MAARFYPDQPENIIAITGTNGKTSTAHFCMELWKHLGHKSASVGTIGIRDYKGKVDFDRENFLTTPDPVKFHQILDVLAKKKITHLAVEASSHGLSQYRLDGMCFSAAAFTNLTRDHLD